MPVPNEKHTVTHRERGHHLGEVIWDAKRKHWQANACLCNLDLDPALYDDTYDLGGRASREEAEAALVGFHEAMAKFGGG